MLHWADMARAAGWRNCHHFDDATAYEAALDDILHQPGPTFVSIATEPGHEGPISRSAAEPAAYLQVSLAEWSRRLRAHLLEPR